MEDPSDHPIWKHVIFPDHFLWKRVYGLNAPAIHEAALSKAEEIQEAADKLGKMVLIKPVVKMSKWINHEMKLEAFVSISYEVIPTGPTGLVH
jgi:hypothetical protein